MSADELELPKVEGFDLVGRTVPSEWINPLTGVYFIRFKYSDMVYIGSSNNLYQRMHGHLGELKRGVHKNLNLQAVYNEHLDCYFTFYVMPNATEHEYRLVEKLCIDMYNEKGRTLNFNTPPIRPVIIHGVRYPSVPAASKALGLTSTGINHRALSPMARFADCYYEGETKESYAHNFSTVSVVVELNGEKLTLAELSQRTGVPYKTIYNRHQRGIPADQLHITKPRKVETYHYQGKDLTLKEWAVELGLTYSTLLRRVIANDYVMSGSLYNSKL